jgi:cytoskeletal protein RodZ
MKTFGQTLASAREKNNLSHSALSTMLHIPMETLIALEEERAEHLPAQPLVRGYVQLLAQALGLNEEGLLALWRRDFSVAKTSPLAPRRNTHWFIKRNFSPRNFSLMLLGIAGILGSGFVFLQWRQLSKPPELSITSPQNLSVLSSPVRLSGKTHPNNTVVVNTQPVSLDPQGRFEQDLELPPGERAIVVNAKDNRGRESETILFVTVSP